MNKWLADWTKNIYPDSRRDLCTCFIERGQNLAVNHGYEALITSDTCMYISSFEQLRKNILSRSTIVGFIDTRGTNAHPDVFDANAGWVLYNAFVEGVKGTYLKLNQAIAAKETGYLEALADPECGWFYRCPASTFFRIPGGVIGYWLSSKTLSAYDKGKPLSSLAAPRKGNSTSNNGKFLRLWYEIPRSHLKIGAMSLVVKDTLVTRWYPYNKGGDFRRWYGNNEYVIDWYNNGSEIRSIPTSVVTNEQYYMKPGLTWSTVSSAKFNIRSFGHGFIFDNGGCCIFDLGDKSNYILGLLNSTIFAEICGSINPTLNFQSGDVSKFPVLFGRESDVNQLVDENIRFAIEDWDSYESSWDFKRHPLL